MDILENLPNVLIYTNVYKKKCPVNVAEFKKHSTEWKYVFNFGVESLFYITIYASKKDFSSDDVSQIARYLNAELRTKGLIDGMISFTSIFAHARATKSTDPRVRNAEISTSTDELMMIRNFRNL